MSAALLAFLVGVAVDHASEGAVGAVGMGATGAAATEVLARPRWIKHVVAPRERPMQIAVRYGVSLSRLVEWNELDPYKPQIRKGDRLRVRAHRVPPPRKKIEVTAKVGDTFGRLAAQYRIELGDLLAYNWRVRELQPGMTVSVWVDPDFPPRTVNVSPGPPIPEHLDAPVGAHSVGRPQRGRLLNGVQLPENPAYTVRQPAIAWGSSHTLAVVQQALFKFRHDTGYDGDIVIGSISRRRGGKFPPHVSHQSGRDIDIRLPLLPGVVGQINPQADEVDWSAAWELAKAFVDTGEVVAIYLEVQLQRRMFQAALWEGMTPEQLAPYLQWPSKAGHAGAIVRHEKGHDGHIHVRFKCHPDELRCKGG